MTGRALDGVRVVEFADELGSYCGKLLADLGAEVIKVEPPGGGSQRHSAPFVHGFEGNPDASLVFWVHNTSKKSVVLDIDTPDGQAAAARLALTADVVIDGYPVGYLAGRGLGYKKLHAARPSLVYTSVTGFGQTGPHASWAYSDIVGQATSGIMTLSGEMADPPGRIYGWQADVSAGLQAAQGTLIALLHAEATSQGQHVDVSAQESSSMSQETAMQTWDFQKKNRVRTGERGSIPVEIPGDGTMKTLDGYIRMVILAPAGEDMPALLDWMREEGKIEDLDEEPYASVIPKLDMRWLTGLMTNPAELGAMLPLFPHINQVVRAFVAGKTSQEVYEEGQKRRLLIGIVSRPSDLTSNPQLRQRGWYVPFPEAPAGGPVEFFGPPYRLELSPAAVSRPPRLGEHTEAVLAALG